MQALLEWFWHTLESVNGVIWHEYVLYTVLGVGVLFTLWSGIGQYTALTHGVQVIRGKYDDKDDPGAINHFQALSAALSATVGLGNIGGVAVAIALGGPGAVFWMWMIGVVGMVLKMTEVTLSMLYRNTDDPENPHGGPMWVADIGFRKMGLGFIGKLVGGTFVVTLLISAITGGNMFQSWNVADITKTYFEVPQVATGIVLSVVVAAVIIGGIKRIGGVAGKLVPFMCAIYLLAAFYVLFMNFGAIPEVIGLIFKSAFSSTDAGGAFIGGTFGYAFLWGMKRALFSSESGQGSAPIAHAAAKTNEPVREGVVAGIGPFIDTIVVCTLTAMVILSSGIWNRDVDIAWDENTAIVAATGDDGVQLTETAGGRILPGWTMAPTPLPRTEGGVDSVFTIVGAEDNADSGNNLQKLGGGVVENDDGAHVEWGTIYAENKPTLEREGLYFSYQGATLTAKAFDSTTAGLGKWMVTLAAWLFAISTMISWSYYGEQGIVYLFGEKFVMPYKFIYCLLIIVASMPFLIADDDQLDALTALGTGVMLWANIPIMLVFGVIAMKAYHAYMGKLRAGDFKDRQHKPASIADVMEGKDVE